MLGLSEDLYKRRNLLLFQIHVLKVRYDSLPDLIITF